VSLNGMTYPEQSTETVIKNSRPFFPDIELQAFKDIYRLPGEYEEAPLIYELKGALRHVNEELIDGVLILQSVIVAETLEAFQAELVDVYQRAVMSWARSGLIKFFETINRKAAAEIQGERGDVLVDEFKGSAYKAIDQLNNRIMKVAEQNGALPAGSKFANGFRASII